jgi:parallel beta-helix repeat protein
MTKYGGYLWGPALALSFFIACAEDATTGPRSGTGSPQSGGPLTASASCGAVTQVCPGESIQAAVNASPTGTTFTIAAGTHRRQSVIPKSGMTFVGEPGAVLDGELITPYAFDGRSKAAGVKIRGLKITRYAPPQQDGAILGQDGKWKTQNWVVEDCEISYNQLAGGGGMGVKLGNGMIVRNNHLHHNDQYGVGGAAADVLVEGNEISFNNWRNAHPRHVAGGTKFVATTGLVVRDNYVHDNQGSGIWTDIGNQGALIEGNRVEKNQRQGIMHEIGHEIVIRNNVIRNNGFDPDLGNWLYGAGILIAHSDGAEVYGNLVEDNWNGIAGIQQNRGDNQLRDLWVHDNTIRMKRGFTGVAGGTTRFDPYKANNRFDRNKYYLGAASKYFKWKQSRTEQEWRSVGMDRNGTFLR